MAKLFDGQKFGHGLPQLSYEAVDKESQADKIHALYRQTRTVCCDCVSAIHGLTLAPEHRRNLSYSHVTAILSCRKYRLWLCAKVINMSRIVQMHLSLRCSASLPGAKLTQKAHNLANTETGWLNKWADSFIQVFVLVLDWDQAQVYTTHDSLRSQASIWWS